MEKLKALFTPLDKYATVLEALGFIADAREYQVGVWLDKLKDATDAGHRSTEEWLCLLQHYQNKLMAVYSESDGATLAGLERIRKYAAIQANLALWLVQATVGAATEFNGCAQAANEQAEALNEPTTARVVKEPDPATITEKLYRSGKFNPMNLREILWLLREAEAGGGFKIVTEPDINPSQQ